VIGLLKPVLTQKFNWSNTTFGNINAIFSIFYAAGLLLFGKIIDSIGTKKGYTIAIVTWSIAAISHAFASTTFAFTAMRSLLGLGEAGNFPSAIKSVAEWFPKKARALATGIFNSGSNIGAVIAPILVPWVLASYGWQEAFVVTGALGFCVADIFGYGCMKFLHVKKISQPQNIIIYTATTKKIPAKKTAAR